MDRKGPIRLRDAARLIAQSVHPSLEDRRGEDRARKAIAYAIKKGHLPPLNGQCLSRNEFLWWAADKWPSFASAVRIPVRPVTVASPVKAAIRFRGNKPDGIAIPCSYEELREAFLDERNQRLALQKELDTARDKLAEWEAEKAITEAHRKKISAVRSWSAKRPRRC